MYKRVNFEPMDKHLSESIRGKLEEAEALIMQLPAGRIRSIALTKLEDTMLRGCDEKRKRNKGLKGAYIWKTSRSGSAIC